MANVGLDFDLNFLDVTTAIKVEAAANATTIDVDSTTGMAAGDAIAIVLDSGDTHWDIISSVTDGDTVVITTGVPSVAAVDNVVKTYHSFMCRNDGDIKMYSVTDSPLLPETLITGSATESNIHPERAIRVGMTDWRKGFQQYKLDDSYTYYDSENCDARMKGVVTLSPKRLSALTKTFSSIPTLENKSLDDWTGNAPDDWTLTGDTDCVTEEVVQVHTAGGSSFEGASDGVGTTKNGTFYQSWTGENFSTEWRGKVVFARIWGKSTNVDGSSYANIVIATDVDSSTSSNVDSTTDFEAAVVTHTVEDTATQLTITVNWEAVYDGQDRYIWVDDIDFGILLYERAIVDGDCEAWDDADTPTIWQEDEEGVDASVERESTNKISGSYSIECSSTDSDYAEAYQDLPFNATTDQGANICIKAWVKTSNDDDTFRMSIDDGVDETTYTFSQNTTAYRYLTHAMNAAATQIRVKFYAHSAVDDCRLWADDVHLYAPVVPTGGIIESVNFGDNIVTAMGGVLLEVNGSSLDFLMGFYPAITSLKVFENRLYIALGWDDTYYYTSDLSTFTSFTDSGGINIKHFGNIGGATLIGSNSNSTVVANTDPVNGGGGWTASPFYQVGSDDWDITGIPDDDSVWYVRKEDDLYYLSGSDVYSLLNLKTEGSTTYTYPVYKWGDNLYIPAGANSLYEYDVSSAVATDISINKYARGDANYDEDVIAMAGDETYLYCAIDNGSNIRILAGRWETVDGDTDWYWHPLYALSSHNDITSMLASSVSGSKRLYVGTDTYTDGIQPYILPIGYAEPYTESGYECESSGNFITPWLDCGFPNEEKLFNEIDVTSICCTSKTSCTVYYQAKGGSWTSLGTLTTSAYDGGYPDETTDTLDIGVSSERMRFKFALAAADDDYTPIIFGTRGGMQVKAKLQSDRTRQINAQLLIAEKINERTRTTLSRTVSTDLTTLRAHYTGNAEETVIGADDTEYTVTFDREGYEEQAAFDETGRKYVWWVTVRLLEA